MRSLFKQGRRVVLGLAVVALAGVVVGCGSGGKSEAKGPTPAEEREVEEFAAENEAELANPHIPHNLEEIVISHPGNEEATTTQLATQIRTNEESSDPTHQQEASCSWLSEYKSYVNYMCMGYALGGTSDAIGQIEVTVDTTNGTVLVETE